MKRTRKRKRSERTINDVRITKLIGAHISQCVEIEHLNAWFRPPYTLNTFAHFRKFKGWSGRVAVQPATANVNMEVLAWCSVEQTRYGLLVDDLTVHPACWRRGVGTRLIEAIQDELQVDDVLVVLCHADDYEQQAFCIALGFESDGILTTCEDHVAFRWEL